jgi:GLPGLI family protein
MKRILFVIICFAFIAHQNAKSQNPVFITQGKIEFEYKLNIYAQLQEEGDDNNEGWKDYVKKNMPQFKTTYFTLAFDNNKTLYQPGKDNPENNKIWFGDDVANENIVYSDFEKQQAISQKKAFEKLFLVKDSVRKIKWKITSETRNIAGFECRRANAIIMDSIYVVAFYTDEIITPGGPESFCGLPGMILGVALPHQHLTWFATKLYTEPLKATDLKVPTKGTVTTNASLKETLKESLKDWGKYADKNVRQIML